MTGTAPDAPLKTGDCFGVTLVGPTSFGILALSSGLDEDGDDGPADAFFFPSGFGRLGRPPGRSMLSGSLMSGSFGREKFGSFSCSEVAGCTGVARVRADDADAAKDTAHIAAPVRAGVKGAVSAGETMLGVGGGKVDGGGSGGRGWRQVGRRDGKETQEWTCEGGNRGGGCSGEIGLKMRGRPAGTDIGKWENSKGFVISWLGDTMKRSARVG